MQNFTLSGANITGLESVGGAAGKLYPDGTVNNVTVQNVTINAKHYAGGIAGYVYGQLSGVHANSVKIALTYDTDADDNGDKGGGLIGYMADSTLLGSTASNVDISGVRDVGGLVGAAVIHYYQLLVTTEQLPQITLRSLRNTIRRWCCW